MKRISFRNIDITNGFCKPRHNGNVCMAVGKIISIRIFLSKRGRNFIDAFVK